MLLFHHINIGEFLLWKAESVSLAAKSNLATIGNQRKQHFFLPIGNKLCQWTDSDLSKGFGNWQVDI
jgi:hypothetical protein